MIGIFGGTFDPVHFGHLRPALEAVQVLGLEHLRFVPCHIPPHRSTPAVDARTRLALLRIAVAGEPGFRVDTRELERPGPSYMVDTLTSLRAELGVRPLCLLLGADAFNGLPGWHRWREIAGLANVVVMTRPGFPPRESGELGDWVRRRRVAGPTELRQTPAGGLWFLPVTQLAISATGIRRALAVGQSVRYWLPEAVRERIMGQGLYGPI